MARTLRCVAAVLLVACAAAGCSSSASDDTTTTDANDTTTSVGGDTTTTGSGPTTTAADTTTTVLEAVYVPLADASLVDVPDGFVLQDDSVGHTGPSDIDKAAADDGTADARTVLTTDGFVAGYQRLWFDDQKDELVVVVYQFTGEAGAQDYSSRGLQDVPSGITAFDVPGIPGARGLSGANTGANGALVSFAEGVYAVQVVGDSSTGTDIAALQQRVSQIATQLFTTLA